MHQSIFYTKKVSTILISMFIILWGNSSCSEVDLKSDNLSQPTRTFQIEWPGDEAVDQPDTLLFVANRMINTWRTAGLVSTQENTIQTLFPTLSASSVPLTSFSLRSGFTKFFALNWNEKYTAIKNLDKLEDYMNFPVSTLELSYTSFPLTDSQVLPAGETWTSYNATKEEDVYLPADLPALWMTESDQVMINQDDDQLLEPITLKAKRLSQQLDIQFSINCGSGVTIDKIRGEISGVPQSIKIETGLFSSQNTLRLIFTADSLSKSSNTVNGKSYTLKTYHKKIDVIALIPNESPTAIIGNGLLQLEITGNYINDVGDLEPMDHVLLINMYHALHKLDLIKVVNLTTPLYKVTTPQATVVIDDILTIDEDGIKVRGQQVQSMDYWTICDDEISIEI